MEKNIKSYKVNDQILTFELEEFGQGIFFAKCKENKKDAFIYPEKDLMSWIEDNHLLIPIKEVINDHLPYGYGIWGGEVRDMLPHGARYYLR